jgi:hypothetical protein
MLSNSKKQILCFIKHKCKGFAALLQQASLFLRFLYREWGTTFCLTEAGQRTGQPVSKVVVSGLGIRLSA